MNINKSQLQAIRHNEGPMLVLAGPGSGKTLVITRRTMNLIEEYGVNPSNILVITFTKAAAGEMKERFHKLTNGMAKGVNFGTFHAVFFTILKYAYNFNGSNIIREDQRYQIFREIIQKLELDIDDEKDVISNMMSEISLVKGERMDVKHYHSINFSHDDFPKIYSYYQEALRRANLIDFDDMLLMCYELLTQRPDILQVWQQRYKYILIDEFQDINQVQYDIIKMLALPENNLFIVGDDDQSIYRFRGAKPEIMLNFNKDYPESLMVKLDINYRSTKKIVSAAANVIKNNKNRFPKNIRTENEEGNEPDIRAFEELKDQNEEVVSKILKYYKAGTPYSQMAVLFRTNTQPRSLVSKLMEFNIPFYMKDNIPDIYEHWISKNILSYIGLARGSRDRALFLQIINRPNRYISRSILRKPTVSIGDLRDAYIDKEWMLDRIYKLEYDLGMLSKMSPFAAINYIRKGIGYDDFLKEYAKEKRISEEELFDLLEELHEGSRDYKTFEDWFNYIKEYRKDLRDQSQKQKDITRDSLTMATMHSSKGLEYKVVFIVDANEGIVPHHKSVLEEDLEEERRLFYVAMTRAKEHLHIYSVKKRYNKEFDPSRFIGEIFIDLDMLKPGVNIRHKTYGDGRIVSNDGKRLVIYFNNLKKERILDIKFCTQNRMITILD
ncbi:MAG: ATP-dependent helicase [Clostridiales bacterium]|nr:ATP-dependent helicase [Clostridiales bacterium]